MTQNIIEPSLYCKLEDRELIGINGNYVDDLLQTGRKYWKIQAKANFERFKSNWERIVSIHIC